MPTSPGAARPDASRPLDGQVAIVTGGSSGIGRATCVALARAGAVVVPVGRDAGRLAETAALVTAARPGAAGPALALDVRRPDDMERMRDATLEAFQRIDILVASAGIGRAGERRVPTPLARLAVSDWDAVVDTNLTGAFLANRAVLPAMLARGRGEIVNVCSARGGLRGQAYAAAYCASKFALLALTEALADEVAAGGVRVQAILPEAVASPLIEATGLGAGRYASMPADRLARALVDMILLPDDALLARPLFAAFHSGAAVS